MTQEYDRRDAISRYLAVIEELQSSLLQQTEANRLLTRQLRLMTAADEEDMREAIMKKAETDRVSKGRWEEP